MSILLTALLALATNDAHDLELASALARRGWVELAEEVCGRINKNQAGLPLVLAEVSVARARREPDVRRAAKELDTAVERLTRAGRAPTLDERGMTGWLHLQKAKLLTQAAQDDAAMGPEALKSWQAAEAFYRGSVAELEKMPANRAVDEALLDARLEIPKAMAAQSRVATIDAARRPALLQESIRLFSDFSFGIALQPVLLEAVLEEGRSRADLKDYGRAERCFLSLPGLARDLKKAGYPIGEYVTAQLHGGVLSLVETLTLAGKAKEAVAACDEFLRDNPRLHRSPVGSGVTLAKADALYELKEEAGAIELARKVDSQAARERILKWTRGKRATPELVMSVADDLIDRGKYREALVELRRCIELCATAADRSKHEPAVLFRRGECFRALKQEMEASVAWQELFRKYPGHESAKRAAFEAVRSLSRASAATGERRDEEQMEKLLEEVEKLGLQGESGSFIKFLRAEILERKQQYKAAADLYALVGEGDVHDDAMVSAGHCYRLGEQPALAEAVLKRVLSRRAAPRLLFTAHHELALLLLSARPKESLDHLEKCASLLPPESPTHARLLESEIQAHLALKDVDAAAVRLEKLLARFPDTASTLRSCRRVASRLESADPAKAGRFYRAWLERASTTPVTTGETQSVADGLYRMARTLNGLEENVLSVTDHKGKPVRHAASWVDAARAHELLILAGGLGEEDAVVASTRLLWCAGFAGDWAKSKAVAEKLLQNNRLIARDGTIDPKALKQKGWLAGVYFEYGQALYQLGKGEQKFQFGNALTVYNNLIPVLMRESESWWFAQFMAAKVRFERGEGRDVGDVAAVLSQLENAHPGFDGGKFGMKDRFVELRDQVTAVSRRQR